MTTPETKLSLRIDEELQQCIKAAIELETVQKEFDSFSNQWTRMQEELDERLQEIGNMVIWEFKEMPF